MGKRSHAVSEDYESIAKKVKKLERKLLHARRRDRHRRTRSPSPASSSDTSSSRSSSSSPSSRSGSCDMAPPPPVPPPPPEQLCIEGMPIQSTSAAATATATAAAATTNLQASTSAAATAPLSARAPAATTLPSTSADATAPLPYTRTESDQLLHEPSDSTPALDDELLEILGEDPSQKKIYGKDIQPDLAVRLQHIATTGLSKENRKELMDKYLPPANCTLLEAPTLNPEVVAAISEVVLKRDKGLEIRQKQRAAATSCVAEALTSLMTSTDSKNNNIIRLLMDAVKIMCDSQNADSVTRRSFVLNNLKKDLKDQLHATKIDKLLFSEGLAETLKAAKAISRSGADMKSATVKQPIAKQKNPPKNLNWRAPPLNVRPKGTQRRKEPVYKDRHASFLKSSSRPAQNRSRNRR